MLISMKTTLMFFSFSIGFLLVGCHDHRRREIVSLPSPPTPITHSSTASNVAPGHEPNVTSTASLPPDRSSAPPEETLQPKYSLSELLLELADAYFDFDRHDLRDDARETLRADSSVLKTIAAQSDENSMIVEGHCDERGSAEYNMALGAMRAEAAKGFLV